MSAADGPLILLVHGAWHGAWCWAALQSELDARGIASLAVDLPGHGTSLLPLTDLHGDASVVRALLDAPGREVVLVGHSYGGAVITEAATGASRVKHLVYLTAFVVDVGESVTGLVRSMPSEPNALARAMVIRDGASTIDPELARDAFYGHCSAAVAGAATARLGPQPLATFAQAATTAAWKSIPSTYVRCTADQAVPLDLQDVMAKRCTSIETLDTDHSPFASKPGETAEIIERIVGSL